MSCEELFDEFEAAQLKEKEETIKAFEETYKMIQNNAATAINTELNATEDNDTEMYNFRNFSFEEIYQNFYFEDNNSEEDTNDESD